MSGVKCGIGNGMFVVEFMGGYFSFGFVENIDDLFVGKMFFYGDVFMWFMKILLILGCIN